MSEAETSQPAVTVGRIVHYVLDTPSYEKSEGLRSTFSDDRDRDRPAIVVRVWSPVMVQLQVFTDGNNDGPGYRSGVVWRTSIHQDEDTKAPGTWHWPERT